MRTGFMTELDILDFLQGSAMYLWVNLQKEKKILQGHDTIVGANIERN